MLLSNTLNLFILNDTCEGWIEEGRSGSADEIYTDDRGFVLNPVERASLVIPFPSSSSLIVSDSDEEGVPFGLSPHESGLQHPGGSRVRRISVERKARQTEEQTLPITRYPIHRLR